MAGWHALAKREHATFQIKIERTMARVRKLPFVLLGLMTALVFFGPFVIWMILRGGRQTEWPPDRPVEWITFVSIVGLVAALMFACVGIAVVNRRDQKKHLGDLEVNLDRNRASNDEMDLKL